MKAIPPRPAAFLDRDGVLIYDDNYVIDPKLVRWMPGAMEAVRRLNDAGYWVFIVSNQAGVARGYFTENDVRVLHKWMQSILAYQRARIDAIRYCPHHPEGTVADYRLVCDCRKPAPGMLMGLMQDFPVQRAGSFIIGDRDSDIAAGKAAGIPGHLFAPGNLDDFVESVLAKLR